MLERAVRSVEAQTVQADQLVVQIDEHSEGASATRTRGMLHVETEWTAFLDDDDELLPQHIQFLTDRADEHGLDMCWGWYTVVGGTDPFPIHQGKQYDPTSAHIFPITILARTSMLHRAAEDMGGFQPDPYGTGNWGIQDQPVWDHMIVTQGAKHMAFPDITWLWHHHGRNTSGLPSRV